MILNCKIRNFQKVSIKCEQNSESPSKYPQTAPCFQTFENNDANLPTPENLKALFPSPRPKSISFSERRIPKCSAPWHPSKLLETPPLSPSQTHLKPLFGFTSDLHSPPPDRESSRPKKLQKLNGSLAQVEHEGGFSLQYRNTLSVHLSSSSALLAAPRSEVEACLRGPSTPFARLAAAPMFVACVARSSAAEAL